MIDIPSKEENPDFAGLEELDLPANALEEIKRVRIEARGIVEYLDPSRIRSWIDLKKKLKSVLKKVEEEEKVSSISSPLSQSVGNN